MSVTPDQIQRARDRDRHFHPLCAYRAAVVIDIETREHRTLGKEEIMQRFSVNRNVATQTQRGVRRLEAAA